jgi:peroxin-10
MSNKQARSIVPQFPLAGQPDIVRSHQKDEYYTSIMFDQIRELCQWFLGSRRVLRLEAELRTMSDLVYYILTTFINQPTLGEEYCDIVQVIDNPQRSPSLLVH